MVTTITHKARIAYNKTLDGISVYQKNLEAATSDFERQIAAGNLVQQYVNIKSNPELFALWKHDIGSRHCTDEEVMGHLKQVIESYHLETGATDTLY